MTRCLQLASPAGEFRVRMKFVQGTIAPRSISMQSSSNVVRLWLGVGARISDRFELSAVERLFVAWHPCGCRQVAGMPELFG